MKEITGEEAQARRDVGLSPQVDESMKNATLESIRAALKIDLSSDAAPGEDWQHPVLGKIRIGPMSYEGNRAIEGVEVFAPVQGQMTLVSARSKDSRTKDELYLLHGIIEPKLTPEIVKEILDYPTHGQATLALIEAIKRHNPTREEIGDQIKMALAGSRFILVLWKVFREAGALKELAKALTLKDDTVEALMNVSHAFEVLMEIEDGAKTLGIPIEAAASRQADQAALRIVSAH